MPRHAEPETGRISVKRNLVLIASYPKSGSTWLRFVFETLAIGPRRTISLNELGTGYYGAWRRVLFDEMAGVNSSDLLPGEIDDQLPLVFRQLSTESQVPLLIKSHDAAGHTPSGEWLYPPDSVRAVIYLVRHPFDVAASYAHHLGITPNEAVSAMGRDSIVAESIVRARLPLHEHVGSWSANVESWMDLSPYDVSWARYEDMLVDPAREFLRLARAAGFPDDEAQICRAVDAARFDRLKNQEVEGGFFERPRSSAHFFRAGGTNSWQGSLDEAMRAKLVSDHGALMERLGYAPDGSTLPKGTAMGQVIA